MPREKPSGVQLRRQALPVTPLQWAFLTDQWAPGEVPPEGCDVAEYFWWGVGDMLTIHEAWEHVRGAILEAWVEEFPGTRPSAWWGYEAPEPRRRTGGVGDPLHEVLRWGERLERGMPADWLTPEWLETYRALHEDPTYTLMNHAHERPAIPVDTGDPPLFESEAAYLERLALLTDAELAELAVRGRPAHEAAAV